MQQQPHYQEIWQAQNKRPSRYILIACTLLALLSIISACGGSASPGTGNGKITITEMDYWSIASQSVVLEQLFKSYEQLHPTIVIQRTAVPFANLLPKADQEAASHTLPNLLALDNPDVAPFAATGALTSLDSFMQGTFNAADYYAGPASTMKYKNQTYSFPVGSNDLALFYDMKLFTNAGLKPPTTWSELLTDAKALTQGNTYGFAFSAPSDEQATFQFEPYLWGNQGDLAKVDSTQGVEALQLLTDLVQKGYASKAALTWSQPDVATQFGEGHAAIMENGPWEIPVLQQQYNMKYGTDFGVVALPVPQTGAKPVSPLGGEAWTIPASQDTATVKATWDLVNWLQQPAQLLKLDGAFGYIPALKSAASTLLQNHPELQIFAGELDTARARTAQLGEKYPKVSEAIWTAEQAALAGTLSPQAALTQAQQQITSILQ